MIMGYILAPFPSIRTENTLRESFGVLSFTDLYKCYSEVPCTAGSCDISPYVPPVSSAACNCARSMHTYEVFQL